jgi:hypothetical protein
MSNEARKSEAHDEPAAIKWRGHEFTVPRDYDDWPVELAEAFEDGRSIAIVRGALGEAQWRKVKAEEPKVRDIRDLADDIATALGFGSVGESAPSSD